MFDGQAFELPTSVPPTTGSDFSFSRHLPTPTAAKAGNDLSLTKSGDGREVPNKLGWAIAKMLPTPRTTDATNSMTAPSAMKHVADGFGTLPEVIGAKLLPTPRTTDSHGPGRHGTGGQDLRTVVAETLTGDPTPKPSNGGSD